MGRTRERWGLTILAFFVIVSVFSFLLVKGSRTVVSDELLLIGLQEKRTENGVLYNYHSIGSGTSGAGITETGSDMTKERLEGGGEPPGAQGEGTPGGRTPPGFIYHKVQSGDSLWKIAKKYNIEIGDIVRENSIPNPDVIYAGSTLKITLKPS